jgi:CheY-like chemotaxis protein
MPSRHTTILFVDDDTGFLEVVQNLMQVRSEGSWQVLTAPDAARALAHIREQRIDLMVIDVRMPVMDGVQFLGLLHRKYPNMLKVVLTGHATEVHRAACLSSGAELFLEKPVSHEGWESLFTALDELVKYQPEEGFQGLLRRVGLQDVLQMECLARSSSVLEISTAETRGSVFVQEGQIIHAQAGALVGEEAFNQLMSLSGGQFNLKPFTEPPARTISGSWEFLLMEAARKRDEAQEPLLEAPAEDPVATTSPPVDHLAPDASAPVGELPDALPTPTPLEAPAATLATMTSEAVPDQRVQGPSTETRRGPRRAGRGRPKIDEVLICSTQGDVLYEWQCADANARIRFLQFLSQKSWQLRQGLPIGPFQRLEIESAAHRVITQIDPDRALLVRVSTAQKADSSGGQSAG